MHDVGRGGAEGGAEVVKVLQVCFVERVPDDLNVESVEIRSGETLSEVWSYGDVGKTRDSSGFHA